MAMVVVGLEHGAAEGADDSPPGFPIQRHVTEPRSRLHVGDACATPASRADPCHRLAAPNHPLLIHQEAEKHHDHYYSSPGGPPPPSSSPLLYNRSCPFVFSIDDHPGFNYLGF